MQITSSDPDAPLDITTNYFTSPHDREVGIAIFRKMREMFASEPIAKRLDHETLRGPRSSDDDRIIDAGLEHGYCGYHTIGTCAMGTADSDVVDSQLRVRGVDNLRVMDCLGVAGDGGREPQRSDHGDGVAGGRHDPRRLIGGIGASGRLPAMLF